MTGSVAQSRADTCMRVKQILAERAADLPPALVQAGRLRLRYPDVSVAELAKRATPPVSTATMYKRLANLQDVEPVGHQQRREQQARAIEAVMARYGDTLPPALVEAGRLRLQHPTVSVDWLATWATPPISMATMWTRLRRLSLYTGPKPRTGRRGSPGATNREALNAINHQRKVDAAQRQTGEVREALRVLGDQIPPVLREAAQLRLDNPDLSLTELGQKADPPGSKNAMGGRLRRLRLLTARAQARKVRRR